MADILVNSGGDLQAAINSAVSGDRILLQLGITFTGTFSLPNKGTLATPIRIRTNTADANLPAANIRITPSYSSVLAKVGSSVNNVAAISCAVGARDYILEFLEFLPRPLGYGAIIALGENTSTFQFDADSPQNITIDRCLIRGDLLTGTKKGIELHGKSLTVKNSWIDRITAAGQEAHGIYGCNGWGPYTITNNYIEAASQNIMFGGDIPQMRTWAAVAASPAPTTTSATLETFRAGHTIATLAVGQTIAAITNGGTIRQHAEVATIVGNAITWSPAFTVAPDSGVGSQVMWGVIPKTITIRRNHLKKQLAWRNPILATPTSVTATPSTAAGSLPAGTHHYVVQARAVGYTGNMIQSAASVQVSATLGATGQVSLAWTAVPNASEYRVYGRAQNGQNIFFTTASTSFTDTGAAGTSGSVSSGTRWTEKCIFEIKQAQDVQMDSNILENQWTGADNGYAVWLKTGNQAGDTVTNTAPFLWSKNITFEKNLIRHCTGAFLFSGHESSGFLTLNKPKRMDTVVLRHVLVHDSNATYVDPGGPSARAFIIARCPHNLTIDHLTVIHHSRGLAYFDGDTGTAGLVIKNSIFRREDHGVLGTGFAEGTASLTGFTTGGYTFQKNVIAGANAAIYPADNFFPTYVDFEANHFVNYDAGRNGDYRLVSGSPWNNAGTDSLDLGCDIDLLTAAIDGVEAGTPEAAPQNSAVFDSASNSAGTGSTTSWAHTCSGTNRVLYVGVSLASTDVVGQSVTFDGVNLTKIAEGNSIGDGPARGEVWRLISPAATTANIVVTLTGAVSHVVGGTSWHTAHQTTPNGTPLTATGESAQATVTIASAATDVCHDFLALRTGVTTVTAGSGQTVYWNRLRDTGQTPIGAGSSKPGTGSNVTFTWNVDNGAAKEWVHTALAIKVFTAVTPPTAATTPSPANGASNVAVLDTTLSWVAGTGATTHDVYFGTSNPPPFVANQTGTTYATGPLLFSTIYYWRIDEVNAGGTATGPVWSFTTAAPVAQLGSLGFTISGIDRTTSIRPTSFAAEYTLGSRAIMQLETVDKGPSTAGAYRPDVDQTSSASLGATKLFDGRIASCNDSALGPPSIGVVAGVQATDFSAALDQRLVTASFAAGQTLKAIVTSIRDTYLAPYGITLDPNMVDGPTMTEIKFDLASVTDVANHLSTITGWINRLTPSRVWQWYDPDDAAIAATYSTSNANISGGVRWSKTRSKYVNRVILRYGTEGIVEKTHVMTGNGSQTVFPLEYPARINPVSNTVIATVVVESGNLFYPVYATIGGVTWGFNNAQNAVTRTPALPNGTPATFTYTVQFPLTVTSDDTTAQAAVGIYEELFEAPETTDKPTAQALADGLRRKFQTQPRELTIKTRITHPSDVIVFPGDVVTVNVPERQVTGRWLVTQTRMKAESDQRLAIEMTCLEGISSQGSWIDYFKEVFGGGTSSRSVGGVISGDIVPAISGRFAGGVTAYAGLGGGGVTNESSLVGGTSFTGPFTGPALQLGRADDSHTWVIVADHLSGGPVKRALLFGEMSKTAPVVYDFGFRQNPSTPVAGEYALVPYATTQLDIGGDPAGFGGNNYKVRNIWASGSARMGGRPYEQGRSFSIGAFTNVAYNAANYTASTGTWGVDSADQFVSRFTIVGETMFYEFNVANTDVSATPTQLRIAVPDGRTIGGTPGANTYQLIRVKNAGGAWAVGLAEFVYGNTYIALYSTVDGGGWSTTTLDNTNAQGNVFFEIQ